MKKLRQTFVEEQPELPAAKLVFVDETATHCNMFRLYGWSPSGQQAVMKGSKHGKRLSMVGAIALDGSRGHMLYEGTLNGERMVEYVNEHLGPNLREGDIVVMDGLRVHKMDIVTEAIESFGARPLILPPYSPELNPIEHAWSTLKARVRALGAATLDELEALVEEIWDELQGFCSGWIRHCGYAAST